MILCPKFADRVEESTLWFYQKQMSQDFYCLMTEADFVM